MIQHKHIVIRAEIKNPPKESEMSYMETWFLSLIHALNMKILRGPITAYCDVSGNKGFTGTCIIETSHIACHIWDESDPALLQLDVYTCGDMDIDVVVRMVQFFEPVKIEYMLLDREHSIKILEHNA